MPYRFVKLIVLLKQYKHLFMILLTVLVLVSCQNLSKDNRAERRQNQLLLSAIDDYQYDDCILNFQYNKQENWLISTIYFPEYTDKLEADNKINVIISNIIELHRRCTQKIILVAHSSTFEVDQMGLNDALLLSLNRALFLKNLLKTNGIAENYIKIYFCANNLNTYIEQSKKAQLYNQKVDIVLLNKKEDKFPCLYNVK